MTRIDQAFIAPAQHAYDLPYHWCMSPFYKYLVGQAVERLSYLIEGRRVIEAGCGDGFVTAHLARSASSVLAFDISDRALAFARLIVTAPNVSFTEGRAQDIASFADKVSAGPEAIVAFELIEHLSSDELDTFLNDARTALQHTNGWLLVTTPNGSRTAARRQNPHHVAEFTPTDLREVIKAAGFAEIAISGLYLQPPWKRLEHFANTVPFRTVFQMLGSRGSSRPQLCRTLVCCARAT